MITIYWHSGTVLACQRNLANRELIMAKKTIGSVPGSVLDMLADLNLKLREGVITPRELEVFLKRRNPFASIQDLITEWRDFYRRFFDVKTVHLKGLNVPERASGYDRLIVMPAGLTVGRTLKVCAKLFDVSFSVKIDSNKDLQSNERSPAEQSYAIWARDCREADEELVGISAAKLIGREISSMTFLERLIYGLKYFDETGCHLDCQRWTLCAGSRAYSDAVPLIGWREDKLCFALRGKNYAEDDFSARAVIG